MRGGSGGLRYYHRNQQYSITAVSDGGGSVVERYAYSAYGQVTIADASGSVISNSAIANRYTYTGREWDEGLSLYHYRARMYDPVGGRFVSLDPIGFSGRQPNLFAYVRANPAKYIDPSGYRITINSHIISDGSSQESQLNFAESVRLALQAIVGDCATITLQNEDAVPRNDNIIDYTGDGERFVNTATVGFTDEKAGCDNDPCWNELKAAITSGRDLPINWQSNQENAYWDDNDMLWPFEGHWGVWINPNPNIPLWEIGESGQYQGTNVTFPVLLWHELIGHGLHGHQHEYHGGSNVVGEGTYYDEAIQCENKARKCLGIRERVHQYFVTPETKPTIGGTY
jgi:RHS repeat-associated protein